MVLGHAAHYLKFAIRNIKKHKVSTALSLSGLALAFSICLITALMVWDAMRSDAFLETADDIYILERHLVHEERGLERFSNRTNGIMRTLINGQVSGAREIFRIQMAEAYAESGGEYPVEIEDFLRVDEGFAKGFPLATIYGDLERTLNEERGLVISSQLSTAIYGSDNPVGEMLEIRVDEKRIPYKVGAVLAPLPPNTHFKIDTLAKLNDSDFDPEYCHLYKWSCTGRVMTYLLLEEGADISLVDQEIDAIRAQHQPPYPSGATATFEVQPLKGMNWFSRDSYGPFGPLADKESLAGVGLAAFVLLLSAIINHTVISAAVARSRGREIAVRKALGATKSQLRAQYFGESISLALGAYGFSIFLAYFFSPTITAMAETNIDLFSGYYWVEILLGFGVAAFVGFIAGLYPVFVMGRGDVSRQLQMNQSNVAGGGLLAQKTFVLLQVAAGIGLVFATLSIYRQVNYLQDMDKGFEYQGVLHMDLREVEPKQRELMKAEIARLSEVSNSTLSLHVPFANFEWNNSYRDSKTDREYELSYMGTDGTFFSFYNVKPLAGRLLSLDNTMDREGVIKNDGRHNERNMVVNLSAMKEIGFSDPEEAIGQVFGMSATFGGQDYYRGYTIVGVVPDFNYRGGKNMVKPYHYGIDLENAGFLSLRFSSPNLSGTIEKLETVWKTFYKEKPFSYNFTDEYLRQAYSQERATSNLLLIIASASVLLSIAGLYGLARNTVNGRKREITLRRVLGAENGDILSLIFRQLSFPIVGGLILGLAFSLWWVTGWLQEFQFRMDVGIDLIAGLVIMVILVSGFTTLRQVIKALRLRPAEILRDE